LPATAVVDVLLDRGAHLGAGFAFILEFFLDLSTSCDELDLCLLSASCDLSNIWFRADVYEKFLSTLIPTDIIGTLR